MKKRSHRFRIFLYILGGLLLAWVIAVQSGCMSMRTADAEWPALLRAKGQSLAPQFIDESSKAGYSVHAVSVSASDSLPLVVMIHGSPGASDAYLDYLGDTVLTRRARLVAIDRPGFGFSHFGHPEISLEVQAVAIDAIVKKLAPGRKVYLVGHSLGGPLVARYAMDYPDRVAGLVIVAGSIDPKMEPHSWWEPLVEYPPLCCLIPKALWASNHEIRKLGDELDKMMPLWPRINCPVRVIHAKDDELVPIENADFAGRMLTSCPDFKTIILPEGNHFILWSRRPLVTETIVGLLTPTAGTGQ
jgi:pimeloyl-ACP methyl ester carboxylesterase